MKKVAIITGYTCNNNCKFCYDIEKRNNNIPDLSTNQIKQKLIIAKNNGCNYVDFLGGEFTIRQDATSLIEFAKDLGFKTIAVTTNGRLFSYINTLRKFSKSGMNHVIFSLHGNTEELHDMQTQVPGSFKQLIKAIENAKELGIDIGTNTTITKLNIEQLPKIAEFLYRIGSRNAEFPFLDPTTGGGNINFDELMPKISEAAPFIKQALDIGKKNKVPHWHIRYFPMCELTGYENFISEATSSFSKEVHFGPEFTNMDVDTSRKVVGKEKSKLCAGCKYDSKCEGVWKRYAEVFGLEELRPVK